MRKLIIWHTILTKEWEDAVRETYLVRDKKTHHNVGTKRFACIDGEGVKGYETPNDVPETHCIKCNNDITHNNRYWISLIGPYCHSCYYSQTSLEIHATYRGKKV
jgi:hypothetical protein